MAQRVDYLEAVQLSDLLLCLIEEGPQDRALYLVLSLNLLHHQFRVGDDSKPPISVTERKVQRGQQPGVLREIVGLDAKELRQLSQHHAVRVLNQRAKTRRSRVAARPPVAVGGDPWASGGQRGREEAGRGGSWGHGISL